jgi:hypothetical protein
MATNEDPSGRFQPIGSNQQVMREVRGQDRDFVEQLLGLHFDVEAGG